MGSSSLSKKSGESKGYIKGGLDKAEKLVQKLHGTGEAVIDSKSN